MFFWASGSILWGFHRGTKKSTLHIRAILLPEGQAEF
jgi:hypothetical protein